MYIRNNSILKCFIYKCFIILFIFVISRWIVCSIFSQYQIYSKARQYFHKNKDTGEKCVNFYSLFTQHHCSFIFIYMLFSCIFCNCYHISNWQLQKLILSSVLYCGCRWNWSPSPSIQSFFFFPELLPIGKIYNVCAYRAKYRIR